MEIAKRQLEHGLELRLRGRVDATWASHLSAVLDECIREGAHHLRLHMADVPYMSSAGLRALMIVHRQVRPVHGSLVVIEPSDEVRRLLQMAGLESLLRETSATPAPATAPSALASEAGPTPAMTRAAPTPVRVVAGSLELEVYRAAVPQAGRCSLIGDPTRLDTGGWRPEHVTALALAPDQFGLGLGAFANRANEGWDRFGEFLAVGSAAAYMPTDGADIPDYLLASGQGLSGLQVLYAATGETNFPCLARFEADPQGDAVTLAALVRAALQVAGADLIGLVMVAQSGGLIGATLKQPPTHRNASRSLFDHPEIRRWLSFTPERVHARSIALVAGFAAKGAEGAPAAFLRPLGSETEPGPLGHFHAVVMPFVPLGKGPLVLAQTVAALFAAGAPQAVLHLLRDRRDMGAGESVFRRGALWFGPATMRPLNNPVSS
jgi:anti-sigma B factor antagonist